MHRSAPDVPRYVPDGAVVTVDGSSGTITVIELPEG